MLFIVKTDFYIQISETAFNKLLKDPAGTTDDTIWQNEVPRSIEFTKSCFFRNNSGRPQNL